CERYAELELAIMRRHRLRVAWRDPGRQRVGPLQPRDLVTRNHEEFLIADTDDGRRLEIRLDRIIRFDTINPDAA
ncbi:MAG: Rho-binding antiterminator, partial [Ectothiorhodospiraceae bacterium]